MVHNGIEYGIMAAYAEGMNILHHANIGSQMTEQDAETAPIENAQEYYSYDFDMPAGRRGLASRLGDRLVAAGPDRRSAGTSRRNARRTSTGRVSDSGEGRWTVLAAIDEGRAGQRAERRRCSPASDPAARPSYGDKLLSAMRKQFGGHDEKHTAER